jgi:hypothetical protein
MADYHVLTMDAKVDSANVVFHFTIPDENNFAARNKRDVVKAFLEASAEGGTITSDYPFIVAGELTQMQAGEIYEHPETVEFDGNLTMAQKRDIIDARWTALNTAVLARLDNEMDFYGYDRDVP